MNSSHTLETKAFTADQLVGRLRELLARERESVFAGIRLLAEIHRRHLDAELGHSSLFLFCQDQLGLSKASSYRRSTAAKLLLEFPAIDPYLASGRLTLVSLCALKDVRR